MRLPRLGLVGALVVFGAPFAASTPRLPAECETAAVGGGWAGLYFAWRLASAGRRVCLFEASRRLGGRTYSHTFQVNEENFTLDIGAYRFSPDMHLPADLILRVLRLPVACYEPSCPIASVDFPPPFHFNYTAPLVRIVDASGQPAGFATALEELAKRISAAGAQIFLEARLTDLVPVRGGAQLIFGEKVISSKQVMLNLPRSDLLGLRSLRAATSPRVAKTQACVKFDLPGEIFGPAQKIQLGRSLTKAYAFYEDAWWHTVLNKTSGQWPTDAFIPVNTSQGIPIGIRFNDGPVRCDGPLQDCRGFLEVFYSGAPETFFEDLRPDPDHPLGVLRREKDVSGKLITLHAAIMEATRQLFRDRRAPQPTVAPAMLVVGVWDREGMGYTAPTKVYYSTLPSVPGGPDPLDRACGVPGLTEEEYRRSMLMPLCAASLLVANNDWVAEATEDLWGDWAEEGLLQAERGLRALGFPRPPWLDRDYYRAKVAAFGASPAQQLWI